MKFKRKTEEIYGANAIKKERKAIQKPFNVVLVKNNKNMYLSNFERSKTLNFVVISQNSNCLGPLVATLLRAFLTENQFISSLYYTISIDYVNLCKDLEGKYLCPFVKKVSLKNAWFPREQVRAMTIENTFWFDVFILPTQEDWICFIEKLWHQASLVVEDKTLYKRLHEIINSALRPTLTSKPYVWVIQESYLDPHVNNQLTTFRKHRIAQCLIAPHLLNLLRNLELHPY